MELINLPRCRKKELSRKDATKKWKVELTVYSQSRFLISKLMNKDTQPLPLSGLDNSKLTKHKHYGIPTCYFHVLIVLLKFKAYLTGSTLE